MRTEPTDLPVSAVAGALASHWGIIDAALTYLPLGFGSHHWRADEASGTSWFVTVDDHRAGRMGFPAAESVAGLGRALGISAALRATAGLDFILAPIPDGAGVLVQPIDGTPYSVAVFPFIEAEPVGPGAYPDEADRRSVLRMVGRIHTATGRVPAGLPRTEDFAIPRRHGLLGALDQLEETWRTGPYAEPARLLLREHRDDILAAFAVFDPLVARLLADRSGWVVTHGEPHARNVLRAGDGKLLLVDWDTAALGPPERDLWMLMPGSGDADWSAYADVTGGADVSADAIRAFRMWWDLFEIAEYVAWFRQPHEATDDMAVAWGGLSETFPFRWGDRL